MPLAGVCTCGDLHELQSIETLKRSQPKCDKSQGASVLQSEFNQEQSRSRSESDRIAVPGVRPRRRRPTSPAINKLCSRPQDSFDVTWSHSGSQHTHPGSVSRSSQDDGGSSRSHVTEYRIPNRPPFFAGWTAATDSQSRLRHRIFYPSPPRSAAIVGHATKLTWYMRWWPRLLV